MITSQELDYTHDISTTQSISQMILILHVQTCFSFSILLDVVAVAGKQELSQMGVAGISVTVTAITTVLICVIIFYFVVHRRRQLSANKVTLPDTQTEFASRKSLHDDPRAEQNTPIGMLPFVNAAVIESENSDSKPEEIYEVIENVKDMESNPAYEDLRSEDGDQANIYKTPSAMYVPMQAYARDTNEKF